MVFRKTNARRTIENASCCTSGDGGVARLTNVSVCMSGGDTPETYTAGSQSGSLGSFDHDSGANSSINGPIVSASAATAQMETDSRSSWPSNV